MWDFGMVSEASRAWVAGENPYDEQALRAKWRAQRVPGVLEHIDHVESLVPPPTLMVMSPFALLAARRGDDRVVCGAMGAAHRRDRDVVRDRRTSPVRPHARCSSLRSS
jgi:hypothetical protein